MRRSRLSRGKQDNEYNLEEPDPGPWTLSCKWLSAVRLIVGKWGCEWPVRSAVTQLTGWRPFLLLNKIDVCCCSAFSSLVQLALEDPSFVQPRAGAWVIKSDYDSVNSEYDLIHSKNTCEACQNSERWWRYLHLSNLDDFRVFQSGKTMLINLLSLLHHISRVSHMFTESCDRSWSFSFSHSQWSAPGNNCHVSCPCSRVGLATSPGPLLNK